MTIRCLAALLIFSLSADAADPAWAIGDAPFRAVFKATEPPNLPEAGWAISVPEFGQTTPNLADIALTDEKGSQIPVSKVFRNDGDRVLLLAQNLTKGQTVYLYFGGNQQRKDLKWDPRVSVLLETRRLPANAKMDDWAQLEASWKAATEVDGAGFVPSVSHTENPFGGNRDFMSHYSGFLRIPDKKATLYTISSDASFILADDRPVFGWPGKHGAQSTEMTAPRGEVNVNDGMVKIDYYHAKEGAVPVMLLGWIRDGKFQAIPADAWVHPGGTEAVGIEHVAGWPVPQPKVRLASQLQLGSDRLFEVVASPAVPIPDGWKARWEWSDGAVYDGPECKRIGIGPAPMKVTLKLINGPQEITATKRVVFTSNMRNDENPGNPDHFLSLIAAEDPVRLAAPTLAAHLALLLARGSDPVIGRYATAWLTKNTNPEDPLWVTAQVARIRFLAITNPQTAVAELRKLDPAIRKKFPLLRILELEILITGVKNGEAAQVAQKIGTEFANTDIARLAKIRMGDLNRLLGKVKEARETYESVQKALPDDTDGSKLSALYQTFSVAIQKMLANHERKAAEDQLAEWELSYPMAKYNSDYLLLRGRWLLMVGRLSEAVQELESFRTIRGDNPFQVTADFYRGRALFELGRAEDAKKIWAEIAAKYPDHELAPEAARLAQ